MANYCDSDDIGVLLNKSFDGSSTPTSTQVTTVITQITGEIDTILASIGISAQPTDSSVLAMLEKYCSFGSAGITGMTYFRNAGDVMKSNAEWYYSKYEQFLKDLREDPEILGVLLGTDSLTVSNQVLDGTYTEDEQEDIFMQSGDFEV